MQKTRGAGGDYGEVKFNWEKGVYTEDTISAEVSKNVKQNIPKYAEVDFDSENF